MAKKVDPNVVAAKPKPIKSSDPVAITHGDKTYWVIKPEVVQISNEGYAQLRDSMVRERRAAGDNLATEDLDLASKLKRLKVEITQLPIREETAAKVIAAIEQDLENAGRARWKLDTTKPDPFPHLRALSAPLFIKEVWKDKIHKGRILRDTIGAYDKDVLQAFDVYVSSRKTRRLDQGDAKGLTLVSSRKLRKDFHPNR